MEYTDSMSFYVLIMAALIPLISLLHSFYFGQKKASLSEFVIIVVIEFIFILAIVGIGLKVSFLEISDTSYMVLVGEAKGNTSEEFGAYAKAYLDDGKIVFWERIELERFLGEKSGDAGQSHGKLEFVELFGGD